MRSATLFGAMAIAALAGAPAEAQTADASVPPSPASIVEPLATDALLKMSRFLQSLRAFEVKATTSTDQVLTTGQKIELDSSTTMWVQRPDHLRVDVASDRRTRQFFYDGKTVTIYGPKYGYYAKAPAPPTLKELAARLADDYGLELPLADLFTWSDDPSQLARLTSAAAIGLATIRGVACDQYVFRQEGLDWQLWLQRGPQPLPRRLVLTTTSDPAQPQHGIDLDWQLAPVPTPAVFAFVPPAGAHQIPLKRSDDADAAAKP